MLKKLLHTAIVIALLLHAIALVVMEQSFLPSP